MMTEISPGQAPDLPPSAGPPDPDGLPALPVQGADDTDVGWGDRAEPDDERLYRERPPHWDSA
jgi:hypothetical protein